MKKFTSLSLALALSASLVAPAFAAENDILTPSQTGPLTYAYEVTVNGVKLDATKLPAADVGYIPGRLVAEADHGSAFWYQEESTGAFYLEGFNVNVSFADNSVTVGEKKLEESALVKNGVTYLPLSIFEGVEGYTVATEENAITITTPNNDPLVKLGYTLIEEIDMTSRMKTEAKGFFTNLELDFDKSFERASVFMGMNINPDTIVLGKLKEGADVEAVKAALELFRQGQEDTFTWYMGQHLEKVQNAKTLVEGDYVLFTICEDYDKAAELFSAWVAEQA